METTRRSLLLRVRDRDNAQAWVEFDAIYRPILQRYAAARGMRGPDADDVVQECMAAILKHIGGFDYDPAKGRFKAWLRTMVNNRVKNLLRGHRDQQAETGDFRRPEQRERSPEEVFDQLWREEHLRHALRLLRSETDEATFEAFERYVIKEQPVERVCEELGINRDQLYRIKWRLGKKLGEVMRELVGEDG